jgi:hypothetical protein
MVMNNITIRLHEIWKNLSHIENIQEKKILCASQLLQELGLNPPYFVGECLINNKQLNKEHLSEAHS